MSAKSWRDARLQSVVIDVGGTVAGAQHFGLPSPAIVAAATIITELGSSPLLRTGCHRSIGALGLAAFTLIATLVASRLGEIVPPERLTVENAFSERLRFVGGFLLAA